MTREEAIKRIEDHMRAHRIGEYPHLLLKDAINMAITALRTQQTTLDRSRWEGCDRCRPELYKHVGFNAEGMYFQARIPETDKFRYCPICGKPRTEEAWAELERRVNGGKTD